jgi:hypothetical protein
MLMHPTLLEKLKCEFEIENNEKRSWGTFFSSQHFKGRRVCWGSRMGIKTNEKQANYSHKPTQTKEQVE